MIEVLESKKHLVAMKISGSITAADIETAYKATEAALKQNERISFFAEVTESMGFTVEGLLKDLWNGIGQIGKLSKYYRAAVVTDKGWLAAMARVEGLVFSSIDVRVFEPSEREKAFAWASEDPEPLPKPEEPAPSLHVLSTTNENVFAFEVNCRIREKDVKTIVDGMRPMLERKGKIDLFARIKDFNGLDLLSVLDDELIRMKLKSYSKIGKVAVVGPKPWMRNLMELLGPILPAEVKSFDSVDEQAAWEWIGAEQALLAGRSE